MSDGTRFALALVILWLAGVALFVAFHPGGIKIDGKPANNPVDILKYFIQLANTGQQDTTGNPAPDVPATTPPPSTGTAV